jgi:hypothetical protein
MTDAKPQGERFSHVYLDRGKLAKDSPTMRRRLAALIPSLPDLKDFGAELPRELGVDVSSSQWGYYWVDFFRDCDLAVALETMTIAWRFLKRKESTGLHDIRAPDKLIGETARIFWEENVNYRIDALGGVHLSIDVEFEANRQVTIATLTGSRYANVLDSIEKAHSRLTEIPPNGKGSIRAVFASAEGLFKLMFPKERRLTAPAVRRQLLPVVQRIYAGDPPALTSASKMVASFSEWVDGAHPYRHEHGGEEVAQPPLELAVNLLSLGITNVRWLAELDVQGGSPEQPRKEVRF